MSGRLVSFVFESRLTPRLKFYAAALASFGRDDGTSIRPSITRMARQCSRSERRVQAALTDLQTLGVLKLVRRHAPSRPTEYRLDLDRLAALDTLPAPPPRRHQLRLPLFPQVFHSGPRDASLTGGEVFHSLHSVHRTVLTSTPDATVTRSVQEILSTSTPSRARERKAAGK